MSAACPTPEKHAHASRGAAYAMRRQLSKARDGLISPDLMPYQCRCGAWHLGHSQVALRKRIRLATRRSSRA